MVHLPDSDETRNNGANARAARSPAAQRTDSARKIRREEKHAIKLDDHGARPAEVERLDGALDPGDGEVPIGRHYRLHNRVATSHPKTRAPADEHIDERLVRV